MSENYSSSEIVNGFRNNDNKIISFVYTNCYQSVYSYIIANSGTLDDVKDILQDALLILYQKSKVKDFKLDCLVSTYVFSITKGIWLDKLRKISKIEYNADELDSNEFLDDDVNKNEKDELYKQMFKQLSSDCQKVLTMYIEGYSMAEINEVMNYKGIDVVKKKKHICKEYLIKLIKNNPKYKELKNEQK